MRGRAGDARRTHSLLLSEPSSSSSPFFPPALSICLSSGLVLGTVTLLASPLGNAVILGTGNFRPIKVHSRALLSSAWDPNHGSSSHARQQEHGHNLAPLLRVKGYSSC